MKLGLHIGDFTFEGGPSMLGPTLKQIATTAEDVGFDRLSVMDHLFQIRGYGPPEHEMLEAYTTLGFLAALTTRVQLLTLVTAAVYREPGLLGEVVTTLDVLSGGRVWLGIGAAWNEEEAKGLGLSFPPIAERFERLEEALQICLQMWGETDEPYHGAHYHLERTLNAPPALRAPHPPILIGGGGERKTLLLVARYVCACNLFPGVDFEAKFDVLRRHCAAEGRDFDEIEKTTVYTLDVGEHGERAEQLVDELANIAAKGFSVVYGGVPHVSTITPLEVIGERVIPAIASL